MKTYTFSLRISADEYLRHYQGRATAVLAVDHRGQRIRFPASALRKHVGHAGIHGTFRLITDDDHKLQSLERIGD